MFMFVGLQAKEDLSKIYPVEHIRLNEKQIQEAVTDNKFFGYFINGVEFEEIHYANGQYSIKIDSGQIIRGSWKSRGDHNSGVCYSIVTGKGHESDHNCARLYKPKKVTGNNNVYYYVQRNETLLYRVIAKITKSDSTEIIELEPKKTIKKTEQKVLYCKRYDGKVFERKDDCGLMEEISKTEYDKGDQKITESKKAEEKLTIEPFPKPEF